MWWHSDFIATFAALAAHHDHKTTGKPSSVQLIHIPYPNAIVEESEKRDIGTEVEVIASVVHDVDHFAVLELNLVESVVQVVDGLYFDVERWIKHVVSVLIRCKLIEDDKDKLSVKRIQTSSRVVRDNWELTCNNKTWTVTRSEFLSQRNSYDCGPIACAKILDLYGLWPKDGKVGKLRPFIVNKYKEMLQGDTDDIFIAVPTIEIMDGASVGAIVRVGNDARDVQEPRSTIGVIFDISDAGGALVCTEWGVVVHGSRRKDHWVSSDRYEVVARSDEDDTAVITPGLAKVREEIRSDKFDRSEKAGVTLQECHKRFVGSSPVRATVGCRCGMGSNGKKSCVAGCGCIKKKVACTSKCACNGNCKTNQFNNRK